MSAYEELLERCAKAMPAVSSTKNNARLILAEVLRTLEAVTPEMVTAWNDDRTPDEIAFPTSEEYASGSWHAMLHASPLAPPAGAP